ncbi:MAG: hypothetical protein IK092_04385, partial [Muribaculaceae bacterium]|nr:hypothetical protein [Muribaculaceae bacterium]
GTPAYVAPEVIDGNLPDSLSDIYSLGVILNQMHPSLKRIASRCCNETPSKRPTIDEIINQLEQPQKNNYKWLAITAIAVITVLIGIFILSQPSEKPTTQPATTTPDTIEVTNAHDTIKPIVTPTTEATHTPINASPTPSDFNTIKHAVEQSVERQATMLFKQYETVIYDESIDPSERANASQNFSNELNKIAIREAARYANVPNIDIRELENEALTHARNIIKDLVSKHH